MNCDYNDDGIKLSLDVDDQEFFLKRCRSGWVNVITESHATNNNFYSNGVSTDITEKRALNSFNQQQIWRTITQEWTEERHNSALSSIIDSGLA